MILIFYRINNHYICILLINNLKTKIMAKSMKPIKSSPAKESKSKVVSKSVKTDKKPQMPVKKGK